MFRSISRFAVTASFILALIVSTVPAQAQPHDFGSSFATVDASWLGAALNWLGGLIGGGGSAPLQGTEASGKRLKNHEGVTETMIGSCLDPLGICVDNG